MPRSKQARRSAESTLPRPASHQLPQDAEIEAVTEVVEALDKAEATAERKIVRAKMRGYGEVIRERHLGPGRPKDFNSTNEFWRWTRGNAPTVEARTYLSQPELVILQYEAWLESILSRRIEALEDEAAGR